MSKQTQRPQGKCIFCGRSPPLIKMSKEHIWSDWLREILPTIELRTEGYTRNFETRPHEWTIRQGHVRTKKVRAVCRDCNGTWMSKIVEDAKPYAKRLIVGDTHLLDIAGQEALSTWIALSALMADQITKHPLKLPASDVAYFFEHKRPPAHWYVGAGFYDGPRVLAFNHAPFRMGHEEADGKEVTDLVKHVYATMIGNLFTIVDVLTFYSLPIAKPPAYYSSYLMQIHPHKFEAIPFPPPSQCMIQGPGQFEVGTHAMKVARMAIDPIVAYLKSIGGSPGFLSK